MNKNTILRLCLTLSAATLLLLGVILTAHTPNQDKNGFTRQPLATLSTPQYELNTPFPVKGLSGTSTSHFYFSSRDPRILLVTDRQLQHPDTLLLKLPMSDTLWNSFTTQVDSPSIAFYNPNKSTILTGHLQDSVLHATILQGLLFSRWALISDQLIAIRAYEEGLNQFFKIADRCSGQIIRKAALLPLADDGGMATDGTLCYDSVTHHLLYVPRYYNTIYCFDTLLQMVYTAKTIDTTNTNTMRTYIHGTKEKKSLTAAVPMHPVNEDAYVMNGLLLVRAGLQADNETKEQFNNHTVLDVYNTVDGSYKGTLYIPDLHQQKPKHLAIIDNQVLVAVYKNYIARYVLNL